MPVYKVKGPDGHVYEFNGPENASQDLVYGYAKKLFDERQAKLSADQNKGTAGDLLTSLKQGAAEIPAGLAGLADVPIGAYRNLSDEEITRIKKRYDK